LPELHFVTGEHLSRLAAKKSVNLLLTLGAEWKHLVTQLERTQPVFQTTGPQQRQDPLYESYHRLPAAK